MRLRGRHTPVPDPPGRADVAADGPRTLTLALVGAGAVTLAPGSRTGLVGAGAGDLLEQLAARLGAALVLPDAAAPLHGAYTVGAQIAAALTGTRRAAVDRATDLLELTGVPEPHHRVGALPHELTALDRQRAQLALALANAPELVLAADPLAGLSPADADMLAFTILRLQARLGHTLIVAAVEPGGVERLVDAILTVPAGATTGHDCQMVRRGSEVGGPDPAGPTGQGSRRNQSSSSSST